MHNLYTLKNGLRVVTEKISESNSISVGIMIQNGSRNESLELNGISQVELSEKIGVSKQTLYKYENNVVTNIPSDKVQAVANILNISPSYLMGWEDNLSSENADIIPDLMSDKELFDSVKKLTELNKEHQQTIFDNIAYWYEKEGH